MQILKTLILIVVILSTNYPGFSQGQKTNEANTTGEQLYAKNCLACHQADGNGVPGAFPPLAKNPKIAGAPKELITTVLFGLQGPITVNGKEYNMVMPPQNYLTDKQIADILTYVRNSWGNKASSITAAQVAEIRKTGKPPVK